jgi:cob(I)alamin adenosyltransferase
MPESTDNESDEQAREAVPELAEGAPGRVPSLVLINTGHGKGKSSAAFGVMGRAWARGWTVGVVQFVKGGKWKVGERKLGRHAWEVAREKLASGLYDMMILDELTYAVTYGWVPVEEVVSGVLNRAPKTNVVITGRDAAPELIEIADTVTEMQMVKHAYQKGIKARKGIEY